MFNKLVLNIKHKTYFDKTNLQWRTPSCSYDFHQRCSRGAEGVDTGSKPGLGVGRVTLRRDRGATVSRLEDTEPGKEFTTTSKEEREKRAGKRGLRADKMS